MLLVLNFAPWSGGYGSRRTYYPEGSIIMLVSVPAASLPACHWWQKSLSELWIIVRWPTKA
jgi:hypothetical protein